MDGAARDDGVVEPSGDDVGGDGSDTGRRGGGDEVSGGGGDTGERGGGDGGVRHGSAAATVGSDDTGDGGRDDGEGASRGGTPAPLSARSGATLGGGTAGSEAGVADERAGASETRREVASDGAARDGGTVEPSGDDVGGGGVATRGSVAAATTR